MSKSRLITVAMAVVAVGIAYRVAPEYLTGETKFLGIF